ncbi:protein LAX PANICLE 2 [Vitis riparia]|uniref:protein LAX PANICLE 2 n=1 Tax=Vitis riparia TaxID=96939 RepID=UPI00155A8178|nr:protein LAX PANICLE 2 [Vitis riparia]
MTMIPARNLSKQCFRGGYGGYTGNYLDENVCLMSRLEGYDCCSEACLGSDLVLAPMAENESRADSVNETGSSSKDMQEDRDEEWLQLSIGGQMTSQERKQHHHHHQLDPMSGRGGMVELNLLPGRSGLQQGRPLGPIIHHLPDFRPPPPRPITNITNSFSTSLFLQQQQPGAASNFPHLQDINWAFRHIPQNITSASSSTSSSFIPQAPYFATPFQLHAPGVDVAGPSSDFRIINANASHRPHSGVWFLLQASQNQAKEPFLPQIPKSYLRIKDGRMTVRLLMKYVANKLRLDSESEIEITCRGQQLLPFFTLQHVRDNIWSPRDALTFLQPDSSTSDHVMVLNYGRSA